MKNTYIKRIVSVLMSLVLCAAFTVTTTVRADAAAGTRTYQVVTQTKNVYQTDGFKASTDVWKYSYNKSGLKTAESLNGGEALSKITYKRNNKGYVTEARRYDKKGKLASRTVYKLKANGNISTATDYSVSGKKSTKECTITYKYWSRGKVKQVTTKGADYTYVDKYNKKGYMTSYSRTWVFGKDKSTDKCTYSYKYDEKGNPVRITTDATSVDEGRTTKNKDVTIFKYTYNKNGNPTQTIRKWTNYENGKKQDSGTITTTYKYKNVKVPEKYWNIYKYKLE